MKLRELIQNLSCWCALPGLPWLLHQQGVALWLALLGGGVLALLLPLLIGLLWPDA